MIGPGQPAPDFELPDQNNERVELSAFRHRQAVLVVFYPLAFTGICTGELARLRDEPGTFAGDRVQALAISVDSPYANKIFSTREGYEFPLLSDFWPHGRVAQSFGVFNAAAGFADRGTFLVDRAGIVQFAECLGPGQARDPDRWVDAIAALPQ